MTFRATIHVMLKPDVADVQGMAIQQALANHNYAVSGVKAGKFFELEVRAESESEARAMLDELANGTFSNPTIESYRVEMAR